MTFLLSNPIGLWALLGIPAILLIHFLQRQAKILPSSTLFLLDAIDRRSLKGRKIDRLRNSLPLWLQLIGVLLLTWLLVEPRWKTDQTRQQIVLVMDQSASMEAFREEAIQQLEQGLPELSRAASHVAYTAIESHPEGETLYRGDDLGDLLASLDEWRPASSAHSSETALRVGRSLAGAGGTLILVSDHIPEDIPYGAVLLAVGSPIENVGFAGQRVDRTPPGSDEGSDTREMTWQVTVRNYSDTPQTREWFLATGNQRTASRTLTLDPNSTRTLAGAFPDGATRIQLMLEPDSFGRDDHLYLVAPEPKPLIVAPNVAPAADELFRSILASLENARLPETGGDSPETPDLIVSTYNPLSPRPFPEVGIGFVNQESVPREFLGDAIVSSNRPLVAHLNWQGLIARRTPSIPPREGDLPLVWQGERPLIVLRESADQRLLLFNFDVIQSNAPRLPAFIVLVDRFANSIRDRKIASRSENMELRQPIPLACDTGENAAPLFLESASGRETIPLERLGLLRSPHEPGFFAVRQGNILLVSGAANFADTREADFTEADSRSELSSLPEQIVVRHTVTDPWWQAWAIALLALALFCWAVIQKRESGADAPIADRDAPQPS